MRDRGYGVGDEPPVAGPVFADHDRGLRHARRARQDGFDLAEFDPEPADLDLVIDPAQELDLAAGVPPGQVPGPVHPLPWRAGQARHEAFRGQGGPVSVAARQLGAGQVQVPGHPGRDRAQRLIQDQRAHAGDRAPDRRDLPVVDVRSAPGGGVHGRLGRPVDVTHLGLG